MKLGFVSAILPDLSLEEVVHFAASEGYDCVEVWNGPWTADDLQAVTFDERGPVADALLLYGQSSPVGVNANIVQPGATGFAARTEPEWRNALMTLIRDAGQRAAEGPEEPEDSILTMGGSR